MVVKGQCNLGDVVDSRVDLLGELQRTLVTERLGLGDQLLTHFEMPRRNVVDEHRAKITVLSLSAKAGLASRKARKAWTSSARSRANGRSACEPHPSVPERSDNYRAWRSLPFWVDAAAPRALIPRHKGDISRTASSSCVFGKRAARLFPHVLGFKVRSGQSSYKRLIPWQDTAGRAIP